jgi:hypothetical protein
MLSLHHLQEEQRAIHYEIAALLAHRQTEALSFTLHGRAYDKHTAPIGSLAQILGSLQALFNRVTHAVKYGVSTKIANHALAATAQLQFAGRFDSSFGMVLTVPSQVDLAGDSPIISACERTVALLNDTQISDETMRLGGWAIGSYRELLTQLNRAGAVPSIAWRDPWGKQPTWTPDSDTLYAMENRLAGIKDVRHTIKETEGHLIDAHKGKLSFELAMGRKTLRGTFPQELIGEIEPLIWQHCHITYRETITQDAGLGRERTTATMLKIRPGKAALK